MILQRSIAFIFFIAFLSLSTQAQALFSADGISPIKSIIMTRSFPSLFNFNTSDFFIYLSCFLGVIISGTLTTRHLGKNIRATLFLVLYILYLSFVTTGGVFMSFQWDALLLESCLLIALYTAFSADQDLRKITKYFFYVLVFKLMFMSGLVKLSSGDSVWSSLKALEYHYQTQPLPNPLLIYFHSLPAWFQSISCLVMFIIELVIPFFIFLGSRLRHFAGLSFIFLQLLIIVSGNYGFFNILTIAICIPLLDLSAIKISKLSIFENSEEILVSNPNIESFLSLKQRKRTLVSKYLVITLLVLYSLVCLMHIINRSGLVLTPIQKVSQSYFRNFGIYCCNNPYGLFAMMTKKRYEIILQGSNDNENWQDYEFRYKPGKLDRIPAQIAPLQPRLDWQMWFAALSTYKHNPWFVNFALKILENNKAVLKQLALNPYPNEAPKFVRALIYEYQFNDPSQENIWRRELKGLYLPSISLKKAEKTENGE